MIQASQLETIGGLLQSLDMHSPGEEEHAQRVAVYSVAVAERFSFSDSELKDICYAALLHDIGKIEIDRDLLSRLGSISQEELAKMRQHAASGERILQAFLWLEGALPMVRHHHERWDGLGYPEQLADVNIPLGARIIGVAEAFDMVTFGSAWREPKGRDAGREMVLVQSGTQFDPEVVRIFLEIEPVIQPVGLP